MEAKKAVEKKHWRDFLVQVLESNIYRASDVSISIADQVSNVLLKVESGGSSGGNCWGGRTSDYDREHDEIKTDLSSELAGALSSLQQAGGWSKEAVADLCNKISDTTWASYDYESFSDYGDYYGNHSKFRVYKVNLIELLDKLIAHELIEQDRKSAFTNSYQDLCAQFRKKLQLASDNEKLEKLSKQLVEFEKTKDEQLKNLQSQLANAQRMVAQLEKQIADFEKQKNMEHFTLNTQFESLQGKLQSKAKSRPG